LQRSDQGHDGVIRCLESALLRGTRRRYREPRKSSGQHETRNQGPGALHHLSSSATTTAAATASTSATAAPESSPAAARRAGTLKAAAASAELLRAAELPALHPSLSVSRGAIALAHTAERAWICPLSAEAARLLTWQVPSTRPGSAALTRLAGRQLAGRGSGPLDLTAARSLTLTPAGALDLAAARPLHLTAARPLTLTGSRSLTMTPAGALNLASTGAASGAEIGTVRQIAGS
jgi:hypothetical protein